MSPGSARSGSPISTNSSVGGDSINKELESVSNFARADADLISKPFDLNEDVRLDEEDDADQISQLRPPTTMINDRSISYGEGISPEVYLLQNQLSRLHMERADSHQFAHRTYSAPVASQLGHLQNPNLSNYTHTSDDASDLHPSALQKQASQELADLVQLPIQTIIQLSPPHLLDHAKEQYAACGLTFPTPSISSFLTVSKALNYLSIFLSSPHKSKRTDAPAFNLSWDIGEMLQGVADGLAGLAAERSVNVVIAHSGANLQHVSVKGSSPVINEGSLSFGLLHILRKILYTAEAGSSLEICLFLTPDPYEHETTTSRLTCTFEIHHHNPSSASVATKSNSVPSPFLANLVTRHILSELVVDLRSRPVYASSSHESHKRSYDFVLTLYEGERLPEARNESPASEASRQPFGQNFLLAREPTLKELEKCAFQTLQQYNADFYCQPNSVFANHVLDYFASWGMTTEVHNISSTEQQEDLSPNGAMLKVSPMSIPGANNPLNEETPSDTTRDTASFGSAVGSITSSGYGDTGSERRSKDNNKPRFVIIDDDIAVFKKKLRQERLKVIKKYHQSLASHTKGINTSINRPTLRTKRTSTSTSQQTQDQSSNQSNQSSDQSGPYFVHFTSLENYKVVIDAVLSARAPLDLAGGDPIDFDLPNMQILPKPAGPRRILTALHTAIHKPVVDPHFRPLATTPMSPSTFSNTSGSRSSRYSSYSLSRSSLGRAEEFDKTPSEHNDHISPSMASQHLSEHLSPPTLHKHMTSDSRMNSNRSGPSATSPMDNTAINYFSHKAAELGEGNKGMIIQSHDGRAAGVFFDPSHSPVEELDIKNDESFEEVKGSSMTQTSALPLRNKRGRRSSNSSSQLSRHGSLRKSALYKPNIGLREMIERAKAGGAVEVDEATGVGKPDLQSRASTTVLNTLGENEERPGTLNHSRSDPAPALYAGVGKDAAPTITSLPKFTLDQSEDIPSSDPASTNEQTPTLTPKLTPQDKSSSSLTEKRSTSTSINSVSTSASTLKGLGSGSGSTGSTSTIGLSGMDIPKSDSPEPTQEQANPFDETVPVQSSSERPALNTRQRSKSVLKSIKDAAQAARRDVQNKFNDARLSSAPQGSSQVNGWMSGSSVTPPINVLIVEDNPINQTILKKFMTRRDVKYDIALNGEEAVEKWRTGNFHLILMDLALPILSGVEAARQIRAHEKHRNIGVFPSTPPSELSPDAQTAEKTVESGLPKDASIRSIASSIQTNFKFRSPVIIVALTASSATSDRVAALEAGCNDFLTKPVNFQWLERKIIEWGCMQALIDIDGWRNFRSKRFSKTTEEQ
ncbi:hypothetical protein E3P99_02982 [Wallemia hederae]|uniref:Response regulatory domain-containing protein n=1 Tax=Wallemia hederae TaxID=1540922 RepID=A0A4T0FI15_9BASI|nr:hypothetical protein E3P99_02982 [Wallemia hederae]